MQCGHLGSIWNSVLFRSKIYLIVRNRNVEGIAPYINVLQKITKCIYSSLRNKNLKIISIYLFFIYRKRNRIRRKTRSSTNRAYISHCLPIEQVGEYQRMRTAPFASIEYVNTTFEANSLGFIWMKIITEAIDQMWWERERERERERESKTKKIITASKICKLASQQKQNKWNLFIDY